MTARSPLSPEALEAALAALPRWTVRDGALYRSFRFADFPSAFAFMTRCAFEAERLGHHPAWTNVYDRVEVLLSTHDCNAITALDLELAAAMDRVA
ncbi:MAG: 4a-hydroxytetrahydrobiopterin dehydratase [Nannocystaceae bacterium]|jgi:4a-hydroxytetrahydrobiopterin dehydratase